MAIPFEEIDLRGLTPEEQQQQMEIYAAEDRRRGFDLHRLPLLRFTLFRLDDNRSRLLKSCHHIILDGWSTGILFKELFELYDNPAALQHSPVVPYSRHIRHLIEKGEGEAEKFWKGYLQGYEPGRLIPDLNKASDQQTIIPKEYVHSLGRSLSEGLEALAQRHGVSLNTVVQCLWAVLLGRYNGRRDVVFGMTSSGRAGQQFGVESMVGLFINTLPVRIQWDSTDTFGSLLARIQLEASEVQEHSHYSLIQIRNQAGVSRDQVLFVLIVVFDNYPIDDMLRKRTGNK